MVCIDVKSFLAELVLMAQKPNSSVNGKTQLSPSRTEDIPFSYTLSSVELCSKANYRAVFISDVPFTPKTFPKEMKMLLSKDEAFENRYAYRLVVNETFMLPSNVSHIGHDLDSNNLRGRSKLI